MRKLQISNLIEEIKPKDPKLHQILKALLKDIPNDASDVAIKIDGKNLNVKDVIDQILADAMFNGDPAGGDLTGTYPNPTISQDFVNRLINLILNATPRTLYILNVTTTVNTASRTSLLSPAFVLDPGFFNKAGKTIRVKASGYMKTGSPAPTLQVGLDIDSNPFLDTGLRNIHPNILNRFWEYEANITYRGGNKLIGQAAFHYASN